MQPNMLPAPVTIEIADRPDLPGQSAQPTRPVTVKSLTMRQSIDDPILRRVIVSFFETRFPVTIWEGDAYDAAGQWTDETLSAAVTAKIASNPEALVREAMSFPARPSREEMQSRAARMKQLFPNGVPRPEFLPIPKKA